MTALLFNDRGWTVTTESWTAASKGDPDQHVVSICYLWSAISGFGLADNSTGVARAELRISMNEFTRMLATKTAGGILDLRKHQ